MGRAAGRTAAGGRGRGRRGTACEGGRSPSRTARPPTGRTTATTSAESVGCRAPPQRWRRRCKRAACRPAGPPPRPCRHAAPPTRWRCSRANARRRATPPPAPRSPGRTRRYSAYSRPAPPSPGSWCTPPPGTRCPDATAPSSSRTPRNAASAASRYNRKPSGRPPATRRLRNCSPTTTDYDCDSRYRIELFAIVTARGHHRRGPCC